MFFWPTFTWPNGTHAQCGFISFTEPSSSSLFKGHNSSLLLDEMTLAAMHRCGILRGFATSDAAADAIENGSAEKLSHYMSWPGQGFGLHENISVRLSNMRTVQAPLIADGSTDNRTYSPTCLTTLLGSWRIMNSDACIWEHNGSIWDNPLWPSSDTSPQVSLFFEYTTDETRGDYRQMVLRISAPKPYRQVAFLWFGPQDASTAACMAQHAPHDVDMFLNNWPCAAPVDPQNKCHQSRNCTLRDLNMSVSGVRIYSYGDEEKYECAGGVDITSPNASAALAKLSAYKDRAKAGLTVDLFGSMRDQTYDDVYAVYTGILGALFGAFVLLVTTLFVYAVAAVKRTCACFEQPAEPV
jgi:hypothetical protein